MSSEIPPPRPGPRGTIVVMERLRDRWTDPRARVGAVLLLAAIAGFVWYQVGRSDASPLAPTSPTHQSARRAPTTTTKPPVLVHVAGAVVHPGLVRVAPSARVADAIDAAGGAVPNADLDRLNLAAKVADGERVLVAVVGAPGAGAESAGAAGGVGGAEASGGAGDGALLNLNTATTEQLDALPGIGPTFAAAILRERERRGGFTSVEQLRDVRGIGEKRFADLKDLVTV
jgi:competence protein ComEA